MRRQRPGADRAGRRQPALGPGSGRHGELARRRPRRRPRARRRDARRRRTSSSPAGTTASRASPSRTTSAGCPLDEARRPEVVLAYEMNGAPLLPQHGFPLRAGRSRLVRDDERQVAAVDHGHGRRLRGLLPRVVVPVPDVRGRPGRAGHAHASPLADDPARRPRVHDARAAASGRAVRDHAAAHGRGRARSRASTSQPTAARRGATPRSSATSTPTGHGSGGRSTGMRRRARTSSAAARATTRGTSSRSSPSGTSAAT